MLFSTPMVSSILRGDKTMTRRTVKIMPIINHSDHCPYGKVGDRLWVRETWCYVIDHESDLLEGMNSRCVYKASVHPDWMEYAKEKYGLKWKPSIHMPKCLSRITLEITNIRIERLQDITDRDATMEGVVLLDERGWKNYNSTDPMCSHLSNPRSSFESLWRKINGNESWGSNPFVWVIEFKQIKNN